MSSSKKALAGLAISGLAAVFVFTFASVASAATPVSPADFTVTQGNCLVTVQPADSANSMGITIVDDQGNPQYGYFEVGVPFLDNFTASGQSDLMTAELFVPGANPGDEAVYVGSTDITVTVDACVDETETAPPTDPPATPVVTPAAPVKVTNAAKGGATGIDQPVNYGPAAAGALALTGLLVAFGLRRRSSKSGA